MENSCTFEKSSHNHRVTSGQIGISARNIRILDLNHVIDESTPQIISMCEDLHLLNGDQISLKSKDVKKVFYHVLIHNLCEAILDNSSQDSTYIYYCRNQTKTRALYQFVSRDEVLIFLNTALNRLASILPIRLVRHNLTMDELESIIEENNGDLEEFLHLLENIDESFRRKMDCAFTFGPALRFAKKYQLQFLEKDYLMRVKTRNLMFS